MKKKKTNFLSILTFIKIGENSIGDDGEVKCFISDESLLQYGVLWVVGDSITIVLPAVSTDEAELFLTNGVSGIKSVNNNIDK